MLTHIGNNVIEGKLWAGVIYYWKLIVDIMSNMHNRFEEFVLQNYTIEWYKAELEKMKKLYYELQSELDKVDVIRKNWTYFTLKREECLKAIATPVMNMEFDTQPLP